MHDDQESLVPKALSPLPRLYTSYRVKSFILKQTGNIE